MTAEERYRAAQAALHNGQYAEALAGLVWFHEHALAESPAWRGVRLSYALRDWVALAQLYPPALAALRDTRERAAATLLRGEGSAGLFRDVAAIDADLHEVPQTYQLFVAIAQQHPALALTCGNAALGALIGAGDFVRAAAVAPDFEAAIRAAGIRFHADLAHIKNTLFARAPSRWAFLTIYLERIGQVLAIATGVGQVTRAAALRRAAIAQVRSPSARREVAAGLTRPPQPPIPERKRMRLQAVRARRQETSARQRPGRPGQEMTLKSNTRSNSQTSAISVISADPPSSTTRR